MPFVVHMKKRRKMVFVRVLCVLMIAVLLWYHSKVIRDYSMSLTPEQQLNASWTLYEIGLSTKGDR